jgi:acyl-CoA synthetase (AMP-forming)/AMP-acid ligase II
VSLTAYLDKGASLGRDAPCLTLDGKSLSYGEVQDLSPRRRQGAGPLRGAGGRQGRDPVRQRRHAFACVFGIARRGAVWCPINPRNTAAENRELLALFDCVALIYAPAYAEVVDGLDCRRWSASTTWTPGSATGPTSPTSRPTTR